MAYQSFPYLGFGRGLNLRDKPDAVDPAECIDALNVGFSERGAIVTRAGYDQRLAATILGLGSFKNSSGTKRLLTTVSARLRAYSENGTEQHDSGVLTAATDAFSFARYGTPSSERVYCSNGTDVRYYSGSGFTNPNSSSVVVPKGRYLAVQATDNRLVSTGFVGATDGPAAATTSPSHVWFSNPGDPATWDANDYVQLTPGDGEKVVGAIAWRELVFVFKQSKFFVFYGNSQNAAGDPVFNYRPVEGGVGLASPFGIAATANGVYFVARDGIYRTTGSSAEKVSEAVTPLWTGNASGYYQGGTITTLAECRLTAVDETLYMAFPSSVNSSAVQRVLVHDTEAGWFSLYDLPAKWVHGLDGELWFGNTTLYLHSGAYTDDEGQVISARWRSGWLDFGSPDIKVVRASKMWGTGIVGASVSSDFDEGQGNLVGITFNELANTPQWAYAGGPNLDDWNTSSWAEPRGLTPKQRRRAERGTTFSFTISGSAPWALHRATHQVRQVRQPGIEDS